MSVHAKITPSGGSAKAVTRLRVLVPAQGPWSAEFEIDGSDVITGKVTIEVGTFALVGTATSSSFGGIVSGRVIAGAGGWATQLRPKDYHSDAGVKAVTVAQDAAREAGETLGGFVPSVERVGIDYVRSIGPASRVLEEAIGSATWWVDYAGVTQVGARTTSTVEEKSYEVLSYEPRSGHATFAAKDDDLTLIGVGSSIGKGLDAPLLVRDLEIEVTEGELKISAWLAPEVSGPGKLASLFKALVKRSTDDVLHGVYRYRVIRMVADRVELQAIRKGAGLPDLLPVSMWPGVAGAHAELQPGAEVLVQFIEGDRTQPFISHFAGKDGKGFVPVSLSFCEGTRGVVRVGDLITSGGAGTVVTLVPVTGSGAPPNNAIVAGVPCLISFSAVAPTPVLAAPLYGTAASGSSKVKSG